MLRATEALAGHRSASAAALRRELDRREADRYRKEVVSAR
jgi:hypothetical protein